MDRWKQRPESRFRFHYEADQMVNKYKWFRKNYRDLILLPF
jgi:hypothetical protein